MNKADIPFLSATELSKLIEKKEVSPVEATEAYIDRIDDLDFKFNAYLTVNHKGALQAAKEAEQQISQGNYLGPMHGIPVAVKDQIWSKGIRTTNGSRILMDFVPDDDSTVVANLRKAGAILLGKLNVTEFAIGMPHRFSIPRNPWNLDYSPGASSSGSGAGTAAFLCASSLGEDTGGSIRFPSSACGLAGIRPSWGRVSRYGVNRGVWSMDAVGPMSRTVEDAAMTLGVIAGYDTKDPYTWDQPVPDYSQALDGNIKGLRVGIIKEQLHAEAVQPQVRDAVLKATSVMAELGASVDEVSIPLTKHAMLVTLVYLNVEPSANYQDYVKDRLHDFAFDNQVALLTGSIMPAQAYYKAQKLRNMIAHQYREALDRYDVLVQPTLGTPPPLIEGRGSESNLRLPFVLTWNSNMLGTPSMSVPCGMSAEGVPIGMLIDGKVFDEQTVFKVAHAYEQATPWHKMRPPHA